MTVACTNVDRVVLSEGYNSFRPGMRVFLSTNKIDCDTHRIPDIAPFAGVTSTMAAAVLIALRTARPRDVRAAILDAYRAMASKPPAKARRSRKR